MPRRGQMAAEQLRRTLQEWDSKLGHAELSADERRDIDRMLRMSLPPAAPGSASRWWPPYLLATRGGLAIVLLLLGAWVWRAVESVSPEHTVSSEVGAGTSQAAPGRDGTIALAPKPGRRVQVQLIASGGTRIVWVLNPTLPAIPTNVEEKSYAK